MSHPLWARVEPVVTELGDNPLYRASGMGMELFHSNVLAWALRTHARAAAPLAELFGFPAVEKYGIWREWRHLDLAVDSGSEGDGLILENKVTALPDMAQLKRYYADVLKQEPRREGRSSFVLLSLLPPVASLPTPWRRVDYRQLSAALRDVAAALTRGFDADFISEYARLASLLADLVDAAGLHGHDDEPYYVDPATQRELRQAGVRDLVLKIRNIGLVQSAAQQSPGEKGGWFEAGWTNGQPLAARFTAPSDVPELGCTHLGWQLQGHHLRLVALLEHPELRGKGPALKKAREDAADKHLGEWFGSHRLSDALPDHITAYTGKKSYNHYDPDFIYRYGSVTPDVLPAELVQALAMLTAAADEQLAEFTGSAG
ncbi:PD-(D/E)XK nuclease family protein [Modestobacter lapidis]|nr:PD-(D/E)XK nuclease family protein [Modestobacter lapidis]